MAIDIEKSFITDNRSVYSFLNQPGQGLYIPFYQREYSWDKDNVEQLLEDLSKGITRISEGNVDKEIRFLGTIITLIEKNRNNIYPQDPQAVPARIEVLIDGQQRLSTIAIIATLLTKQLYSILKKVKNNDLLFESIKEICDIWINQRLIHIFSFDLGRGKPKIKPKIIRGARDFWTRDKDVDEAYKSELASYLGDFIKAFDKSEAFPKPNKEKLGQVLFQNVRKIEIWLKETVTCAHTKLNEDFPPAWEIIKHLSQDQIWEFERPALKKIINERIESPIFNILCELVQVLSVCHFLLDRCCFTIIQPTDEDWAFDMFQSLNATGTPLTAIETFKPTVVNDNGYDKNTSGFKDSENEINFSKIDKLFENTNTAQQKNKRTSDFLTSFFVAFDGTSVSSHFSYQRRMLIDTYNSYELFYDRVDFIRFLGNYAEFYKTVWTDYDSDKSAALESLKDLPDANLTSMLILFLKSSNHKMAITILASFYRDIIDKRDGAIKNFIEIVKVVAAFYALWRSAYPNSGLDAVYRDLFKKNGWKHEKQLSVIEVKEHLRDALKTKGILDFSTWHSHSNSFLRYDNAGPNICRLALLVSSHDTIVDKTHLGLMKEGRVSSSKYLCLEEWNSNSLKSIEHIAPQTNDGNWDVSLYDDATLLYHSIGNLTLLPQNINSSAGNKSWKEKHLYFSCIGETDPQKLQEISELAKSQDIKLNDNTVALLQKSKYSEHIKPLIEFGQNSIWDAKIVNARSQKIIQLFWDRISPWLYN